MRSGIAWMIAGFSLSALPAFACSCGGNPNSCQVPAADIIVRATVVSKDSARMPLALPTPATSGRLQRADRPAGIVQPPQPWGSVTVTLHVSERFQGNAGDSLIVRTEVSTEACGYPFEVGHEYLVFATESQGKATVTICSATQPAKMAVARILQLRALRDGAPLPDVYGFVGTQPLRWSQEGWEQVQPVAGLTVTARSETAEFRTQTAEDGLYTFQNLPHGRYRMSVDAPSGRRALWGNAEHPGTSPGIPCAMNFQLFWDGLISGTVLDRDGQPVSGMITAQYAGPETQPAGSFGGQVNEGRFEIQKLPPGRYRLMFLPIAAGKATGPAVYYPGTPLQSAADQIEVGEGAHIDGLQFRIF